MAYRINEKCTKCGACLLECPTQAITDGRTKYVIDADTCDNHAACVSVCPVNAIEPIQVSVETHKPPSPTPKR